MTKRRGAVLTIVHNEAVLFPIWLKYYSQFFAAQDIYVLDHDTTDGSTQVEGFTRIPVSHDGVDNNWILNTVEIQQHKLIEHYDVVLTVDVDEIVAPHPKRCTLGEYIERFNGDFVNCRGFEILHQKGTEPPLDPARPVLQQRNFWFEAPAYFKPALASVPMEWVLGFHAQRDGLYVEDPNLFLLHLHRVDYDLCLARHHSWAKRPWNPQDVESGFSVHNRIVDTAEFQRWFYQDRGVKGWPITVERIPEDWKDVV